MVQSTTEKRIEIEVLREAKAVAGDAEVVKSAGRLRRERIAKRAAKELTEGVGPLFLPKLRRELTLAATVLH
mgnify:CR=1 FL=1